MKSFKSRFIEMFGDPNNNFGQWNETNIGAVSQCIAGATPSTKVESYWKDGTIPWMSSGEVRNKRIFDTETKITQEGYNSCSTKMVPINTVVIALAGQGSTRGMAAITQVELCTNQSLCSIVTDDSVNSEFLLYYLQTQYDILRNSSNGANGRGGLNLEIIKKHRLFVPPLELQNQFADFVKQVDKSKFIISKMSDLVGLASSIRFQTRFQTYLNM